MRLITTKFSVERSYNDNDGRMVELWDTSNTATQCAYLYIPLKLLPTTDVTTYTKDLPAPTYIDADNVNLILGWAFDPIQTGVIYLHLCELVSDESV